MIFIFSTIPKKRKPKLSDLDKTGTKIYGVCCAILVLIYLAILMLLRLD